MISRISRQVALLLTKLRRKVLASPIVNGVILPALPRSARWALRKAYFLPFDVLDRISGQRDDLVPPRSLMYDGSVDGFRRNGEIVVQRQLIGIGGLQAEDAVLDIGSGLGRQAVALTQYLTGAGRYDGLDIVPKAISWCQKNITPRYPNFRFHLSDIYNEEYNPRGTLRAQDFGFPFPDAAFDFAFLTSVFTHMLPNDVEHYVAEIARVLKNDGRCFATFFLLNEESLRLMAEGRSVVDYKYNYGIYRAVSNKVPELNISYDETFVLDLFKKNGLEPSQPVYHGGWDGRKGDSPHLGQQDIVVTRKVAPTTPGVS
jgi:SAM-dependent methyltransferase